MDAKKAIEVLKSNYPDAHYTLLCEAVDLAIKTLGKEVEQNDNVNN